MDVLWSGGQVKLTAVVLLGTISTQKQFHNLRLQDEQNSKFKHGSILTNKPSNFEKLI